MLELFSVTIGQRINSLSFTVNDGQLVSVSGPSGSGKTTLLRAILGLTSIDSGFISIDGELLTQASAPYFRRNIAYVPQDLIVPQFYNDKPFEHWEELSSDARYILLLDHAIQSRKPLLIVDESRQKLTEETSVRVISMLEEASQSGTTILAVNNRIHNNLIQL